MVNESVSPVSRMWLQSPVAVERDHVRGDPTSEHAVEVVLYGDYLCPYCRRLRPIIAQLRETLGDRLVYVFRHFPNERVHPGAEFIARATEAAGKQGFFWEMHDRLYAQEQPLTQADVMEYARALRLSMQRFKQDLDSSETRARVEEDLSQGRGNGVTETPTIFVDGLRYDGAWDPHSILEALQRPIAQRLERSARAFASLPASGGLALLLAAAAALVCANTPLAPWYRSLIESSFNIGPPTAILSLTVAEWCSEGLLAVFFLLVGLEIRREMTAGALAEWRAAVLPAVGAVGGVLAPAGIYLVLNSGATAPGWSVPTATDVAFTLGILAILGTRIPPSLRVFVAALAVVDDVLSVLTLAIFYPRAFEPSWLVASAMGVAILYALNRGRVYRAWPYVVVSIALWISLHASGVHGALTGVILAALLPTRPAPAASPLLAQAATALDALENAEKREIPKAEREAIWDWASRNLSAASERLLSPADRIEQTVSPWSAYLILPLFAFSATGVSFHVDLSSPDAARILAGVILGLVIGKPLGIALASLIAIKSRIAVAAEGITLANFIGAACLCGVGDTVALLMADQAFPQGPYSALAKISVLVGSVLAAALGAVVLSLATSSRAGSSVVENS